MRSGNWIKIFLFVLLAFMLAGITQVLLDPGLGTPDEARRARHPAGFSFVPPRGWGVTTYFAVGGDTKDSFRISPEKSVGQQPSIGVARLHVATTPDPDAQSMTFQGKPAFRTVIRKPRFWQWRIDFERDGVWYFINATYPTEIDIEGGPLWKFIESFRVEPVMNLGSTLPTTVPSTRPLEGVTP